MFEENLQILIPKGMHTGNSNVWTQAHDYPMLQYNKSVVCLMIDSRLLHPESTEFLMSSGLNFFQGASELDHFYTKTVCLEDQHPVSIIRLVFVYVILLVLLRLASFSVCISVCWQGICYM